ncbi:hypothetical protein DPMN_032877 [Dreissena polymorpha]|uniref:Uncharacterized protein n=1 Tax=Dreissena polymorpha TaxID=45954 RepID=A0A9D4M2N4_DREPO|nr:hypothetical protein DPMN_032877 [Dreissena polymorpha]
MPLLNVIPDAPLNVSRHLPVFISFSIDIRQDETRVTYRWSNSKEINEYKIAVSEHLRSTQLDYTDVNGTCSHIVRCISSAAEKCLSKRTYKRFFKPFRSSELKNKHHQLRLARLALIWSGRRTGQQEYAHYKAIKKTFRRDLRMASHRYDEEEMERIDTLAEIDQKAFWKVVNSKCTKSKQNGCELDFDGKRETTIDGVLRGWNSHFKRLYSFEENPKFDPFHKELVENSVTKYLNTPDVDHDYIGSNNQGTTKQQKRITRQHHI